jgi:excisionase family DNA binding protein
MTNEMTPGLIKQSEAAEYLGLSEATLERDRWRGGEIPYIKVGTRSIRYSLDQLEEYVQSRTVKNISEKY